MSCKSCDQEFQQKDSREPPPRFHQLLFVCHAARVEKQGIGPMTPTCFSCSARAKCVRGTNTTAMILQ